MSTVTTGALLIIFLPFLLSLFGQSGQAKMLCLTSSILGLLLSGYLAWLRELVGPSAWM